MNCLVFAEPVLLTPRVLSQPPGSSDRMRGVGSTGSAKTKQFIVGDHFSTEKSNHMTKVKSSFRRRKFFFDSDYSLTFLVISCPKSYLLWGDSIFMIR